MILSFGLYLQPTCYKLIQKVSFQGCTLSMLNIDYSSKWKLPRRNTILHQPFSCYEIRISLSVSRHPTWTPIFDINGKGYICCFFCDYITYILWQSLVVLWMMVWWTTINLFIWILKHKKLSILLYVLGKCLYLGWMKMGTKTTKLLVNTVRRHTAAPKTNQK